MEIGDKYVGRILDNRYEILERIGVGGMALVYKARCQRLNRLVAIKILKEELASDEEFRRRFHTESQAVAMLSHPNIVAVYDVSRAANTEYIVMELIEGITLKQYINRKGLLNWKEALHFATQITKALSHAHSRGIIHRDIKPHNIMILKDGSVKVADFGIARLLTMQNTLTQEALGSVHYISPEQAKGGYVDARSDIYSVGVVMYEMLTSRLPFVGDSAVSVAIQHISAIPLMPRDINPDIPEGLENITMHAMEPSINLRFTTADEMLADLEEFRKNPAVTFDYAADVPFAADVDTQETKPVPSPEEVRAERARFMKKPTGKRAEKPPEKKDSAPPRAAKKPPVRPQEMNKEEYLVAKTRARSTSTMIGIFCVVVFIVVVGVFMWRFMLGDIFNPQRGGEIEVTIPSFVGRILEDVTDNEVYTQRFRFSRSFQDDNRPEGTIISQSPLSGEQVTTIEGRLVEISLVVSRGEADPVYMPDFLNVHISHARNELTRMNLNLEVTSRSEPNDDITRDWVIETVPAAGEPLIRGAHITIVYSSGPEIVQERVPDNLVGLPIATVERELNRLGFSVEIDWIENPAVPEGIVTFVSSEGQMRSVRSRIYVSVSLGPPELPPDPDPEPDPNGGQEDPGPQLPPQDDPDIWADIDADDEP